MNPCVLLSKPHQNLMVKTTVLLNMLHLELYRINAQNQTTRNDTQGRILKKKKKQTAKLEYSVLLPLQHYIICGWVLFLLAFKWTQLSIISIFDLPWDSLLWFYEVSIHFTEQSKVENVEKSKPLSKNKLENTSIDTVLKNGGIAFYFFPPNPSHYFMENMVTYISVWICKS